MLGGEGLTEASRMAILSANYLKARLEEHFPVLYTGPHGTVAHEMSWTAAASRRTWAWTRRTSPNGSWIMASTPPP